MRFFLWVLLLALILLKLMGKIAIGWGLVFAPLYVLVAIFVIVLVLAVFRD